MISIWIDGTAIHRGNAIKDEEGKAAPFPPSLIAQISQKMACGRFFCFRGTMLLMKTEYTVKDLDELPAVVQDVLEEVRERQDGGYAAVLALHGDLGAGKTTFVQTLAQALGISEVVNSPTFVVMKKYDTTDENFPQLVHIDAYRIEDESEMTPLRFAEELQNKDSLIAIEWAENIVSLLPPTTIHLNFTLTGEERLIKITHGQSN